MSEDGGAREPEADARVSSREALRFLTRAGRVLSASLDPEQTLTRLVRLAVPRVACFAMIDLVRPEGRLERVAHAHVDEARRPLLDRPLPFRPEEEGLVPFTHVLETRQPLRIEQVERDWTGGEEILERIRRLGGQSLMIVPFLSGNELLGVLTFGSTRTDRFYHPTDLSLAGELARSAGLALENARLYREAERAIAARDEVLAVVSHDLRNPVTRVKLAAEGMVHAYDVPEGAEEMAEMIVEAADEMDRLIGDLLDVTRIEAGRLSLEAAPTSLREILERLEAAHALAAEEAGLAWEVELPEEPLTMEVDVGRLLQAFGNLVGNAIKFTPEGGEVRVVAKPAGDRVLIGVRDSGPGMDEEQLAHVFDRFWQSRSGDRGGAGLGLAIARGIVLAHEGEIRFESEVGVGTTAWVELQGMMEYLDAGD